MLTCGERLIRLTITNDKSDDDDDDQNSHPTTSSTYTKPICPFTFELVNKFQRFQINEIQIRFSIDADALSVRKEGASTAVTALDFDGGYQLKGLEVPNSEMFFSDGDEAKTVGKEVAPKDFLKGRV